MKVELQGRVASVGIGRDGEQYTTLEVPDARFVNQPDFLHLKAVCRLGASAKVTVEVEE